jgi:ribosomal protein S18 acetylase RimI-like enzyme
MLQIQPARYGTSAVCAPILRALPQWFGLEDANIAYIADIEAHLTFVATVEAEPVGFLTLVQHTPSAAEIHVMGVLPTQHRQGTGRALVAAAEAYLQAQGVRFLQVKTLSARHPDAGYAKTRAFYQAVGFVPLEEFSDLWGEQNPCLQMIKVVGE